MKKKHVLTGFLFFQLFFVVNEYALSQRLYFGFNLTPVFSVFQMSKVNQDFIFAKNSYNVYYNNQKVQVRYAARSWGAGVTVSFAYRRARVSIEPRYFNHVYKHLIRKIQPTYSGYDIQETEITGNNFELPILLSYNFRFPAEIDKLSSSFIPYYFIETGLVLVYPNYWDGDRNKHDIYNNYINILYDNMPYQNFCVGLGIRMDNFKFSIRYQHRINELNQGRTEMSLVSLHIVKYFNSIVWRM